MSRTCTWSVPRSISSPRAGRRVTLVGLRGAERLLPRAQALCAEAGLTARGIWRPDGLDCDIAVESRR